MQITIEAPESALPTIREALAKTGLKAPDGTDLFTLHSEQQPEAAINLNDNYRMTAVLAWSLAHAHERLTSDEENPALFQEEAQTLMAHDPPLAGEIIVAMNGYTQDKVLLRAMWDETKLVSDHFWNNAAPERQAQIERYVAATKSKNRG